MCPFFVVSHFRDAPLYVSTKKNKATRHIFHTQTVFCVFLCFITRQGYGVGGLPPAEEERSRKGMVPLPATVAILWHR